MVAAGSLSFVDLTTFLAEAQRVLGPEGVVVVYRYLLRSVRAASADRVRLLVRGGAADARQLIICSSSVRNMIRSSGSSG